MGKLKLVELEGKRSRVLEGSMGSRELDISAAGELEDIVTWFVAAAVWLALLPPASGVNRSTVPSTVVR